MNFFHPDNFGIARWLLCTSLVIATMGVFADGPHLTVFGGLLGLAGIIIEIKDQ